MREPRNKARRARNVNVRWYLSELLGLSLTALTNKFGRKEGYSPSVIRQYIVNRGFVPPKRGERAKGRTVKDTIP